MGVQNGSRPIIGKPVSLGFLKEMERNETGKRLLKKTKVENKDGPYLKKNPEGSQDRSLTSSREDYTQRRKRRGNDVGSKSSVSKPTIPSVVVSPHGGGKSWKKVTRSNQPDPQEQEVAEGVLQGPEVPTENRCFANETRYEPNSPMGNSDLAVATE